MLLCSRREMYILCGVTPTACHCNSCIMPQKPSKAKGNLLEQVIPMHVRTKEAWLHTDFYLVLI